MLLMGHASSKARSAQSYSLYAEVYGNMKHTFPKATAIAANPISPPFLVLVFCDVAKS